MLDRDGVSSVVGSVLIISIIVVVMGGVILWGVPAIKSLQEHAEFQSVLAQAVQVNDEIRSLRDPQNTRPSTFSTNQGLLSMSDGSRWVSSVYTDAAYSVVTVSGYEDGASSSITITNVPSTSSVSADQALGGTFVRQATLATCTGSCALSLGAYRLEDTVTRIQVVNGGVVKVESWILESGRMTYDMHAPSTDREIIFEMGGLVHRQDKGMFLEESPSMKLPDYTITPADTALDFRFFQYGGDTSASGKGRHSVLANLVDNYGSTRGRPTIDNAVGARFQIDDGGSSSAAGRLEAGWCQYFKTLPYVTQTTNGGSCTAGDVSLLYDPPDGAGTNNGRFRYQFTQSEVTIVLRD